MSLPILPSSAASVTWPPIGIKPYYVDDAVCIIHGDCRDILPTLPKVDLVLTDPPYGADVKYGDAYDDNRDKYWEWFLPALKELTTKFPTVIFTHRNSALGKIQGQDWVGVWDKGKGGVGGARIGNSPIVPQWEPIFMFGIHRYGTDSNGFPDVIKLRPNIGNAKVGGIGREKWKTGSIDYHPCPKPLSLYIKLIEIFGQKTDYILDPFMGSGTTLRAAKDLGRKAIGIEIEEKYCEIAAKRMAQEVLI